MKKLKPGDKETITPPQMLNCFSSDGWHSGPLLPRTPASAHRALLLLRRLTQRPSPPSEGACLCPLLLLRRLTAALSSPGWGSAEHVAQVWEEMDIAPGAAGHPPGRPSQDARLCPPRPEVGDAPGRLTCSLLTSEVDGREASEPSRGL